MAFTIDAGQLRHLITLQTPTRTPSALTNEMQLAWTDTRTVWASVKPASAKDLPNYQTNQALITHEVICRYSDDITSDCRFNYNGRILNIVGVPMNQEERNVTLKIMCSEAA